MAQTMNVYARTNQQSVSQVYPDKNKVFQTLPDD